MSVRSQLAALTLVAVCLPLVAVLGSGLVMFGRHDFEKILFVSGASGAVALACALLLGRRILKPLEHLRAASARLADLTESAANLEARLLEDEKLLQAARESLLKSEKTHDEAREHRTAAQVRRAEVQAQLQVAEDRKRHLSEEFSSARVRVESLQSELGTLSEADAQLARQLESWRTELDARQRTLESTEQRLTEAEQSAHASFIASLGQKAIWLDYRPTATV